ncbi:NPCBM/NEW2 domain-containing protein, partial [bacterium]|nr:NPCBM/NEW2 domain-containing protein [bacterium]
SETEHIRVNVEGAQELKLTVENAGDGDTCDHASWADAMVY